MHMFEVEVVLMITIFIKLALCACHFNVIPYGTIVQAQSPFDSVLKALTSDWKIRSFNTELRNGFNLIPMTDDFYIQKHSTRCVLQYMFWEFSKIHCKVSAAELRFWIVYYHAKFFVWYEFIYIFWSWKWARSVGYIFLKLFLEDILTTAQWYYLILIH